jgi:WD40 repeat protein
VYEAATWRLLQTLAAEGLEINLWRYGHTLAFSPDGQRLAFRDGGRYAHVWDLKSGKLMHRFDSGNADEQHSFCAFAPDGLLALSDRAAFRFYDPATGKEKRSVGAANVVALSPDGKYFVRRTPDPQPVKLFLCDTATGKDLHAFETTVQMWPQVSFSPDGKRLALVPKDGSAVEVWDADKRALVKRLPAPEKTHPSRWRYAGGLTPDGSEVWLALYSGDVARWDAATFRELPRLVAGADQAPKGLFPLPDGRTLLAPCDYTWVRVFDCATGRERTIPDRYGWDTYFALSPDGEFVAAGDESGRIDLLDAATGQRVRTLRETGAPLHGLVFGPDGAALGAGDGWSGLGRKNFDITVRAFWVADGKELWSRVTEKDGTVWALTPLGFTDEDRAVVAHYPDHVRTWNTRTGQEVSRLSVRGYSAVVCPAGRFLAYDDDDAVTLFDLRTGRVAKRIPIDPEEGAQKPHPDSVRLAWSADGRTLVTTLPGDRVCILDPVAGKERTRFTVHDGKTDARAEDAARRRGDRSIVAALSPDGKRLLATARQHTALWDTRTGKQLAKLEPGFHITRVAFSPDGKSVFTFGSSGLGYRWDVEKLLVK